MKNPIKTIAKYFGGMYLLLAVSGIAMVYSSKLIKSFNGTIISSEFLNGITGIIFSTFILYITKRITGTKIYISTPGLSAFISLLAALIFTEEIGTFILVICITLSFMVNLFSLSSIMSIPK